MRHGFTSGAWAVVLLLAAGRPSTAQHTLLDLETATPSFTVTPFHPSIKWSGRINTIAVHPVDPQRITVASDSGGLFQSPDGGEHWFHLDGLPVSSMVSVAYHPSDALTLFATSRADFKAANGAGVWRSENGGRTWVQVFRSSEDPSCQPTTARPDNLPASAWDITFEPETGAVYVATDCGLGVSTDLGATWTRRIAANSVRKIFHSIQALGRGRLVGVGAAGAYHSQDGGVSWRRATGRAVVTESWHALSKSPHDPNVVYAIDADGKLVRSRNGGSFWEVALPAFSDPPAGRDGCGGVGFVKAVPSAVPSRTELFASNRCNVYHAVGRSWTALEVDHSDTRDLAFVDGRPTYLATDGGFHVPDGGHWVSRGGGRRGLNALQLYEVTGQRIVGDNPSIGSRRHDLYIGTQDNRLWSTDTAGRTWPYFRGAEGFFIDLARAVRNESDSKVAFTACASCATLLSGAHFRDEGDFKDATTCATGYASLGEGVYFQGGQLKIEGPPSVWRCSLPTQYFYLTEDYGDVWHPLGEAVPWKVASRPHVSSDSRHNPVVYSAVRMTGGVYRLVRNAIVGGESTALYPGFRERLPSGECGAELSGHGGLGRRGHQFVWQAIFGVDPHDPMHLIAPDPADDEIKVSWDGGECWAPLPGARDLVTHGGTLASVRDTASGEWASLISAVSFHPQNATLAMMGGREGGLYFSHNRGRSWQPVPGSERIPNVTAIHWKSLNEVYVSSYGRGLWRLDINYTAPPQSFADACGDPCLLADVDLPFPPRPFGDQIFDTALITYEGSVMDVRLENGLLRGVSVTPGTVRIVTTKDTKKLVAAGALTNSSGSEKEPPVEEIDAPGEFKGLEAARKLLDQGWIIKGLAAVDGKVRYIVVSKEEAVIDPPGNVVPFVDTGLPESAIPKGPYVTADFDEAGGALTIAGTRFRPGRPVIVTLDGRRVKAPTHVHKDGSFALTLRPRLVPGQHLVRADQKHGKHVLSDKTSFEAPTADGAGENDEKEGVN